jgi:NAD(P)-dependent dehydrogenase (short-subunit alcohol dehydrogenase family)
VIGPDKTADEVTEKEFDTVMNVDVKGSFFGVKHVVPFIREVGGGSIVNMSSICGLVSSETGLSPYHAAKGAVTVMTKNMAIGFAKEGIRVNSVHPARLSPPVLELGSRMEKEPERQWRNTLDEKRQESFGILQVHKSSLQKPISHSRWKK